MQVQFTFSFGFFLLSPFFGGCPPPEPPAAEPPPLWLPPVPPPPVPLLGDEVAAAVEVPAAPAERRVWTGTDFAGICNAFLFN